MRRNQIIEGDFFETEIPKEVFTLIIMDIAYFISSGRKFTRKECADLNMNFGEWDHFDSEDEYLQYVFHILDICHKSLSEKGTLYMFITERHISYARKYAEKLGMFYRTTFTWVKSNPPMRFSKRTFGSSCEFCMVIQKNKDKAIFNFLGDVKMRNYMITPVVGGKERLKDVDGSTLHPTQKPVKLYKRFIEISSNSGDFVGDFMMGVGTTPVACKELGRRYFCIEKNEKYFTAGVERVNRTECVVEQEGDFCAI